jgi:hypothetical protein
MMFAFLGWYREIHEVVQDVLILLVTLVVARGRV